MQLKHEDVQFLLKAVACYEKLLINELWDTPEMKFVEGYLESIGRCCRLEGDLKKELGGCKDDKVVKAQAIR